MGTAGDLREPQNILDLFAAQKLSNNGFVAVSAPMVRYSKYVMNKRELVHIYNVPQNRLEFRQLLRKYGVKLCFTPMIIADSFNQSENARLNEFTTNEHDQPLIAQFAAKSADEFVTAAQLVHPYVDGVDLNCGCPQSWAIAKGYGCSLLKEPQKVHDIVRTVRRVLPQNFSCSIKIRLLSEDVASTVELARQMENCGVTFLTVHGRTQWQKCSHPVNVSAMSEIKKSVQIPIIVNGNVRNLHDAIELHQDTNADGVMAARGLLSNPALFDKRYSYENDTPIECVQNWLDIAAAAGENISFQCFHHHLTFMWSKNMKRSLRTQFNNFSHKVDVFNFFDNVFNLRPSLILDTSYTNCIYRTRENISLNSSSYIEECAHKDMGAKPLGNYFLEFKKEIINDAYSYDLEESFLHNL